MFQDRNGNNLNLATILSKSLIRIETIELEFELYFLSIIGHIPSRTIRRYFYNTAGLSMPSDSTIYMGAQFFKPNGITIGHDTAIGKNVFLDGRDTLTIGNHTDIASDVLIYNDQHNIHDTNFGNVYGKVEIGDYVFIGPRSIILPGLKIGNGAVVAAGAVVTKDIPEYEIWGGIPAKKISDRKAKNLKYKIGRTMMFQ